METNSNHHLQKKLSSIVPCIQIEKRRNESPMPVGSSLYLNFKVAVGNGLQNSLSQLSQRAITDTQLEQYPNTAPLQLLGSTLPGRVYCGTDLAECVSAPGDFLRPQGAFPPGFYPLWEVGFIARRLRHP